MHDHYLIYERTIQYSHYLQKTKIKIESTILTERSVQPQQPLPAEETIKQPNSAPVMTGPLTIHQALTPEQPWILTPPVYFIARLLFTSAEMNFNSHESESFLAGEY